MEDDHRSLENRRIKNYNDCFSLLLILPIVLMKNGISSSSSSYSNLTLTTSVTEKTGLSYKIILLS